MKKLMTTASILLLSAGATLPAAAADSDDRPSRLDRREHHERMRGMHVERLARVLDLTDQQIEEINTLEGAADEVDHEALAALHDEIDSLVAADRPDPTAIGNLVLELHQRRDAITEQREARHEAMMEILTPEQRELFTRLREVRSEHGGEGRHGERRQRHPRRHGPSRLN